MNENIKVNKEENPILKFEENKTNTSIQKTNLFVSQKLNNPEEDNQNTKKRCIKFISFKKPYFKVENKTVYKKQSLHNPNIRDGRWTEEERNKFIQGIVLYGINWKKVKTLIPTRSAVQVRSHAQKFFHKLKLCKDENLGIDFTLKSIHNFRDMINQIKSKNQNYNIIFILKKLSQEGVNRRFFKKIKKIKKARYEMHNNNITKNEDKNELIKLDENNNCMYNNCILNHNNNTNMNLFDNNIIGQNINNNCNSNNNQFNNINLIYNNIFNNKGNTLLNKLNNSLNLNSNNNPLSNNFLDKLSNNNKLLNDYFINDPYINYLSIINDLLILRIKLLEAFISFDNINLLNRIKDLNLLNINPLINNNNAKINNNIFINNNNPIINNNNLSISNNIPIIDNNSPLLSINNTQIENNIPLIKNKLMNNENKQNDILIEVKKNEN